MDGSLLCPCPPQFEPCITVYDGRNCVDYDGLLRKFWVNLQIHLHVGAMCTSPLSSLQKWPSCSRRKGVFRITVAHLLACNVDRAVNLRKPAPIYSPDSEVEVLAERTQTTLLFVLTVPELGKM